MKVSKLGIDTLFIKNEGVELGASKLTQETKLDKILKKILFNFVNRDLFANLDNLDTLIV